MRTTMGFPPLDHAPSEDSTVTARLKAAGGILMGKTNVQLLLNDALQSTNPIFGRSNNPWDTKRSPGGSSGGAAAAIASGMTPFDIGSDLAGSIRIPAHFCGLFGLKPTENRVSSAGFFPDPNHTPRSIRIIMSLGPMARTIEDLELLFSILAGSDSRDPEVHPVPVGDVPALKLKDLRIASATVFKEMPIAADIGAALSELTDLLGKAGAKISDTALPSLDFGLEGRRTGELLGMVSGVFQPQEQPTTLAQYMEVLHKRDQSIRVWEEFFDRWDVLLCPVSITSAIPHCEPGTALTVNGQSVEYGLGNAHCAIFNYTGHPAVVLPYKRDQQGLPIGIQLVGKRWNEARLLGIAKAIAQITGDFKRPFA